MAIRIATGLIAAYMRLCGFKGWTSSGHRVFGSQIPTGSNGTALYGKMPQGQPYETNPPIFPPIWILGLRSISVANDLGL